MKINGVELNTRIQGNGTPFVWGHGLMSSMALEDSVPWRIQWEQLADLVKVVRYDARGHGLSAASDAPESYHWSKLAQDMLAIADHVGFERFIAGGQSMGCATTLYAALAAPERIRAMVLVIPPTVWETRAAQATNYDHMAAIIETQGVDALADLMQQTPPTPAWQRQAMPDLEANFQSALRQFKARTLTQVLRGAKLCNLPPREELTKLTMPTLILAWADDPGHPVSSAEAIAKLLPNSQLIIAHSAEETMMRTQAIRAFIEQLP